MPEFKKLHPLACTFLCTFLLAGACDAGTATTSITVSVRILPRPSEVLRDEAVVTITDGNGKIHVLDSQQRYRFATDPESIIREFFSPENSPNPIRIDILY